MISQVARIRPRFHLHAGDLCYADMTGHGQPTDAFSSGAWDQWLTQIEPVASSSPWMCATGNHEMESGFGSQGYDGYLNRFWVPGGGAPGCPATYSFRYGNVGFVSLDSNDVSFEIPHNLGYLGGRQSSWLEQRLAAFHTPGSGVDFVVVFFHHCVYSTSGAHGSEGGVRENWVPLFDRYQVDLVVNGHAHVYERTSQLRHGQVTHHVERSEHVDASVGTTYITAGGGGFRSDGGFMQTGALVVQAHGVKQREQAPWSRPTRTTRHSFLAVHVTPRSIVDGDATRSRPSFGVNDTDVGSLDSRQAPEEGPASVSLMRNSRLPATWQTLLTDQVTCCSSSIRTSPAQIRAVSAPAQDHDSSPPSRAGPGRAD